MSISPGDKLLFFGFEFQQRIQRGIYFYAKALIAAAKQSGYSTGILTEARHYNNADTALIKIAKALEEPPHYNGSLLLRSIKYAALRWAGIAKFHEVKNKDLLLEEHFWFLRDVDYFLNIQGFYHTSFLSNVFGATPLPVPIDFSLSMDFSRSYGYAAAIAVSPMFVTRSHRKQVLIQTVHDVIPVKVPMHREDNRPEFFYARLRAIEKSADLILIMSEFTRHQFLELFPHAEDRCRVLYQPVPASPLELELSINPLMQRAVLKKYGLQTKKYLFYVGAMEARKNIHRLVDAYQVTQRELDIPLVLAGPMDEGYLHERGIRQHFDIYSPEKAERANMMLPIAAWGMSGRGSEKETVRFGQPKKKEYGIRYIGYITNIEKLCLIRNATAMVFPSLSEGFGIPVLEAQSLGCPVITSRAASIPEVCGTAAHYIDNAFRVEEIASALLEVTKDESLRRTLSEVGLKQSEKFSSTTFTSAFQSLLSAL